MKKFILVFLPALLFAQAPARSPATQSPASQSQASKTPPPISWKSIHFPPLKKVTIPKVDESTMPNGMKIYLLENHELPLVSGLALVRTGNLFDPADKVGLATVTGNLIRTGGTSKKSSDQIDEELENIAASVESQIGESYGTVSFSTLNERTEDVLTTFRDLITDPAFRQDKIDLVKTQLRSGIARRNDDARGISQREFSDLIYGPKTPYGWQMEYATVGNIQRQDLVDFYHRYYFPANVILAVQGDFNAAEMKARLEKLFAAWTVKQPAVPAFPKVQNEAKSGVYVATKTDVTQTSFAMGQLGGTLADKDYPALQVMADILGGGFRSRLFQKVRTQLGYAYDISADWGANYDHPGMFEISGSTKSASTTEALLTVQKELQRIRTEEVSAEELETAKQTVVNSFVFNFDTPSKTLNRLLTYRYFGYPDDFIFQYQKAVQNVTRADILRVAKQYIDPSKMVVVAVGNPKEIATPLSKLGMPVNDIDLTIPEPAGRPKTTASLGRGIVANVAMVGAPEYPPGMLKNAPPEETLGSVLLSRLQKALGGMEALAAVKDLEIKTEAKVSPSAGGLKVTQVNQWLLPATFRQENVLPFGKVISYYDGTRGTDSGWLSTPQGLLPLQAAQKQQIETELFRNWISLALSANLPGRKVTGEDGKLTVSDDEGNKVTVLFHPETRLPIKEIYLLGGVTVEEEYSDWQETSGIQLPHKVAVTQNGKKYLDAQVLEVKINTGLTKDQMSKKP